MTLSEHDSEAWERYPLNINRYKVTARRRGEKSIVVEPREMKFF